MKRYPFNIAKWRCDLKKINIVIFTSLLIMFLLPNNANADSIKKGTISLVGGSNLFYRTQEYDEADSRNTMSIYLNIGYFIMKDLALDLGLGYERYDRDKYHKVEEIFSPGVHYYIPLNTVTSFYVRLGVAWYRYDSDDYGSGSSWDEDSFKIGGGLGFSIFMNQHVAFDFGVSLWKVEWSSDDYAFDNENETRIVIPGVGIKVFF